jgi:hypothetical protein
LENLNLFVEEIYKLAMSMFFRLVGLSLSTEDA